MKIGFSNAIGSICWPAFFLATMTLAEALRSLRLFSAEVMPKIAHP